jgi:hypothetical protein
LSFGENMALGGLFKKKPEEGKAAAPNGDVPDELPPLGEESAPATAAQNAIEEPPEELPGLDEKKRDAVEIPSSIRVERHVSAVEPVETADETSDEIKKEQELPAGPGGSPNDGFFSILSQQIKDGKPVGSLLSHDLLSNMKENWGIRKESSKTGLTSSEEKRVTTSISEILGQLKLMESKWRAHKMIVDEYEKLTKEQEDKIKDKEKELKNLLKIYKLYQRVPSDRVIMLKDSIPISNLSDAINSIRSMDQLTFSSLVNKRRNDFSRLASYIDQKLGNDLRSAKTKNTTLKCLEIFAKKLSE